MTLYDDKETRSLENVIASNRLDRAKLGLLVLAVAMASSFCAGLSGLSAILA